MNEFTYSDLIIGLEETMQCQVTPQDIEKFCAFSGDWSTIHVDDEYAQGRGFDKRLVHGLLVGSLISGFVGMKLPGKHGLLQSMNLQFRRPCYAPNTLTIEGKVRRRSDATKTITIDISVRDESGTEIVSAQANSVLKL